MGILSKDFLYDWIVLLFKGQFYKKKCIHTADRHNILQIRETDFYMKSPTVWKIVAFKREILKF
jgi:hypothetical protein